jgi:ubiquinone/menaquinone biosynthesis C-methylase UbiE
MHASCAPYPAESSDRFLQTWYEVDDDFIRRRYRRLAKIYPLFNLIFALPRRLRARAVERLDLRAGERVVEVGCGTGANFGSILAAIGENGVLYGVDISPDMLAVADRRCSKRGWRNVALVRASADAYTLPEQVDAALFSLSYSVIPKRQAALRHAWGCLRVGGRLVIMDGKLPQGLLGTLLRPIVTASSAWSVLGKLDTRPWEDLRELTEDVVFEKYSLGTYFICSATRRES